MSNKIQAGLELIAAINAENLSPQELISILHDLITKDWRLIHEIINAAVEKKLIEREEKTYRITPETSGLEFETPKITKITERGVCSRCGKQISVCHYVEIMSRTYGPFGSTCIRKVKLME
jgi:predicted methyltransferase